MWRKFNSLYITIPLFLLFIWDYLHEPSSIESSRVPNLESSIKTTKLTSTRARTSTKYVATTEEPWVVQNETRFDPAKHILVFLHIQKTSGNSFDQHIASHLLVNHSNQNRWTRACEKRATLNINDRLSDDMWNKLSPVARKRIEKQERDVKYQCKINFAKSNWYIGHVSFCKVLFWRF
jgi:hypothetical protein